MLTRNIVLLFSLSVLLVEGDMDSNVAGIEAMSTDKDSTSDEAPTESMNVISPDQPENMNVIFPDQPAAATNGVTATEAVAAAANSVEAEDDDNNVDSEENGKKKFRLRAAKAQRAAFLQPNPAHAIQSPAHLPQIPIPPPQQIIPHPKVLVRNRMSKRRSKSRRRQI